MTAGEIVAFLENRAPCAEAESWDNPGLLAGSADAVVTGAVVTLDITSAAIETAVSQHAELLISHHPVIFEPLRRLERDSVPWLLAAHGLNAFCAHTNLDKAAGGVNDTLTLRLGLRRCAAAADGLCRVGELPELLTPQALAEQVGKTLHTAVRLASGRREGIRTVAVCGGAGGGELLTLRPLPDALLSGEWKHHEWLAAVRQGVAALDAGHYATEAPVVDTVADWLRERFPALRVYRHHEGAPYITV